MVESLTGIFVKMGIKKDIKSINIPMNPHDASDANKMQMELVIELQLIHPFDGLKLNRQERI